LTHYGGAYFFHEFLQVLQVRDFLARHLAYPRRNHRYSLSQMILALVYPIVLGLDRLETVSFLRFNGTFQYLTGLPNFPDPQTLRRFLHQAPDSFLKQLHRVNDRLLQSFVHLPEHRSRLIFDLDSSVVTVFGRQQKAEVGYNPRYRGKRSYNPLLCLEATPPICGIPNCGQVMLAHGMAALNCWHLVSSTYHQIFGNCVCGRMPALVSIRSWKSSKPDRRSMQSWPA
jgi:hypothetical protein